MWQKLIKGGTLARLQDLHGIDKQRGEGKARPGMGTWEVTKSAQKTADNSDWLNGTVSARDLSLNG